MSCAGHLRQTRMRDMALEHFHDGWWRDDVVLTHDQERGHLQGTDLLGCWPRDRHLTAWRIEGANLLIEKSLCGLLLGEVPGIGAWRGIGLGQRGFTFGAQLRHTGITESARGVSHDQRLHTLWIGECEPQAGPSPHGLGYQRDALDPEMIEQ